MRILDEEASGLKDWCRMMNNNGSLKKIADDGHGMKLFETKRTMLIGSGVIYLDSVYHLWDGDRWITSTIIYESTRVIWKARIKERRRIARQKKSRLDRIIGAVLAGRLTLNEAAQRLGMSPEKLKYRMDHASVNVGEATGRHNQHHN